MNCGIDWSIKLGMGDPVKFYKEVARPHQALFDQSIAMCFVLVVEGQSGGSWGM